MIAPGTVDASVPRITLRDVARTAGVSDTAASFVLRGRSARLGLSEGVQRRVTAAARSLGYRPNRTAVSLRNSRTQVVGFLAPNARDGGQALSNYSVHPFVVGLNHRLVEDHYHVAYLEVAELDADTPEGLPPVLRERFFDGLVVHYGVAPGTAERFAAAAVPVLWWDSGVFAATNCLYRDETAVARRLTEHLIALGHRRIGYAVGETGWQQYQRGETMHYSYAQRYEAYRAAMRAHRFPHHELVGYDLSAIATQLQREALTAVIVQGQAPLFLLQAAAAAGLSVPRDLSIASLDVEIRVPRSGCRVGGMAYDRYAAGRQAADMLLAMLEDTRHTVPSATLAASFEPGDTIQEANARARVYDCEEM